VVQKKYDYIEEAFRKHIQQLQAVGWWKYKEEIQSVLGEYVKLVNFWLFDLQKL